jgi:hypothetical protein
MKEYNEYLVLEVLEPISFARVKEGCKVEK